MSLMSSESPNALTSDGWAGLDDTRLTLLDHPLVTDAMTRLRSRSTTSEEFRQGIRFVAGFLSYEATRHLPLTAEQVTTPLDIETEGGRLRAKVIAVPILRAGLGMVDGFLDTWPATDVGFVGLKRNEETLIPDEYYRNIPECRGAEVFVLDPMLATGGSAGCAIRELTQLSPNSVSLVSVIASPQGVAAIQREFPDVRITIAALDEGLNEIGYIVPGLGDAGDRLWGT